MDGRTILTASLQVNLTFMEMLFQFSTLLRLLFLVFVVFLEKKTKNSQTSTRILLIFCSILCHWADMGLTQQSSQAVANATDNTFKWVRYARVPALALKQVRPHAFAAARDASSDHYFPRRRPKGAIDSALVTWN